MTGHLLKVLVPLTKKRKHMKETKMEPIMKTIPKKVRMTGFHLILSLGSYRMTIVTCFSQTLEKATLTLF